MAPLEGPVGVGVLVDAILLGCLVVQSCVYYKNSQASRWLLNILVALMLFFMFSQFGCIAAWLWANGREASSDASVDGFAAILFGVSNASGAVISFCERFFFTHRILKLSNNHFLALVFFISCVFSFMVALGVACIFFAETTTDLMNQLRGGWIFPLFIISGLVCDLAISATIAYYLRFQMPTEVTGVLGRITRLFLAIAETGSMTSLFDIALVIVYWLTKPNFAWVGLLVSMPGVLANCLLAVMNVIGKLSVGIEHQRASTLGDNVIDEQAKRSPIKVAISRQVEMRTEKNPV